MPKIHEFIDSLNNDNVEELRETLKAEASALQKENSRLYARAKKAEGFVQDPETKKWIKEEKKTEPKAEPKPQSNEPDYAKLAFLEQRGIKHSDDIKVVMEEAERLKLPLTDILGMAHIQTKLKDANDTREAQAGMPKGRGKGGGATKQDVDYWLAKGETPQDLELAEKVIDARSKKEASKNKFSDEMYSG